MPACMLVRTGTRNQTPRAGSGFRSAERSLPSRPSSAGLMFCDEDLTAPTV